MLGFPALQWLKIYAGVTVYNNVANYHLHKQSHNCIYLPVHLSANSMQVDSLTREAVNNTHSSSSSSYKDGNNDFKDILKEIKLED